MQPWEMGKTNFRGNKAKKKHPTYAENNIYSNVRCNVTTERAKTGVAAHRRHPSNTNLPERGQDKHKGLQIATTSS